MMMMIDGWTAEQMAALERAGANTATGTGKTYQAYKAGDKTGDIGYSKTINPPKMMGWICPVCGRGLSPWTSVCPCKGYPKMEVTC